MTLINKEDLKVAFHLICCICGIGTLGMPGNFARTGPLIGLFAFAFMGAVNIYAAIVCSKVMLYAPPSVQSFSDLGDYCMGKVGRYIVLMSQMAVCLMTPCVFLVLGGNFLSSIFPDSFPESVWSLLMALSVLPISLQSNAKEGLSTAVAGCLATIVADLLAITVLLTGMAGHPSVPAPPFRMSQVAGAFGNLSLAFGAGIVIPSLQRNHSDPSRMPRTVGISLFVVLLLFTALAAAGYSVTGCQLSSNLLFIIYPDPKTKLTALGFEGNLGAAVLAYIFMQLHINIAFAYILHPAFFLLERMLLGTRVTNKLPVRTEREVPLTENVEHSSETWDMHDVKRIVLRLSVIAALLGVATVFKDQLNAFMDLIGASCLSLSCILLPILFYLKKHWKDVPFYEKIWGVSVLLCCSVLGAYVTYQSGKAMFTKASNPVAYPFCEGEYREILYFNPIALNQSKAL